MVDPISKLRLRAAGCHRHRLGTLTYNCTNDILGANRSGDNHDPTARPTQPPPPGKTRYNLEASRLSDGAVRTDYPPGKLNHPSPMAKCLNLIGQVLKQLPLTLVQLDNP